MGSLVSKVFDRANILGTRKGGINISKILDPLNIVGKVTFGKTTAPGVDQAEKSKLLRYKKLRAKGRKTIMTTELKDFK